jgi:hypothetical protein
MLLVEGEAVTGTDEGFIAKTGRRTKCPTSGVKRAAEQLADENHLANHIVLATHFALPFSTMSVASIPRKVRCTGESEPQPLASHVWRWCCDAFSHRTSH